MNTSEDQQKSLKWCPRMPMSQDRWFGHLMRRRNDERHVAREIMEMEVLGT